MQKGGLIDNPNKVQAIINKYGKNKSALNAKDYIEVSKSTGVPIELLLAQGAAESNFGIYGRANRTRNVGNVGNTDSGAASFQKSWKDGLYRQANLLKNEYNVSSNKDVQRLLDTRFARPKGGNYATDPNYSTKVGSILNQISNNSFNLNASSQNYPNLQYTSQAAPDISKYADIFKNMQQGLWDMEDPNTVEAYQKAPGLAELMMKQGLTQQETERNMALDNQRAEQEARKKETEIQNMELQNALIMKQQEKERVLSMIPTAVSVADGQVSTTLM